MDWIPAFTTTSLLGAALWLSRSLVAERLKRSVKHEFDVKLDNVRAEVRAGEEHLKAVRSTALTALAAGQTVLNQRRLQAIDDLWASTMALKSGSALVGVIGRLDLDVAAKHLHEQPTQQFVKFIENFGAGFPERLKAAKDADASRPYVTPMAWALHEAYRAIVMLSWVQLQALKAGVDPLRFTKTNQTVELVKTALPEFVPLLDEQGAAAFSILLPDLEERLLAELRASAAGRDSDPESVERATRVGKLIAKHEEERVKQEAGL